MYTGARLSPHLHNLRTDFGHLLRVDSHNDITTFCNSHSFLYCRCQLCRSHCKCAVGDFGFQSMRGTGWYDHRIINCHSFTKSETSIVILETTILTFPKCDHQSDVSCWNAKGISNATRNSLLKHGVIQKGRGIGHGQNKPSSNYQLDILPDQGSRSPSNGGCCARDRLCYSGSRGGILGVANPYTICRCGRFRDSCCS